ncbi:MAG: endo alpha-1,4 polygalactosaminidase [Planctomycetota bacterium]
MLACSFAGARPPFLQVESWAYQLTGYNNEALDRLAAADVDLLVIDLSIDGSDTDFTPDQLAKLRGDRGKWLLAYFEIGAIEEYRPEWDETPRELMAGPVDGWPSEQYVRYWDERWWPVVCGRIDRAIDNGFDGAYLDMLTTYEEIPDSGLTSEQRAERMVDLVRRLTRYARRRAPDFKVIAQNCPELANWAFWEPRVNQPYLTAIDGVAIESPFYLPHDELCKESWCEENRTNALAIKSRGKLLLGVDYVTQEDTRRDSISRQSKAGFVPLTARRALDQTLLPEDGAAGE